MKVGTPGAFGTHLKALREAAGFTQEELATIAGLSVHAVSALERGERRRPHVETVRALSVALDLGGAAREALLASARPPAHAVAVAEPSDVSLPLPLTALLGRDLDLQTLEQWLGDEAVRLVTLIGAGGVGKSRLALELARRVAGEGSTRVVFVPLADIRDPAFVVSAIAEALGLEGATAADLPKRARLACDDLLTLLVVDNFEHVLEAAPVVGDLLSSVGSLRVLATSRAPLRVRGEREYAVEPLALEVSAEALTAKHLAGSPAIRLFVDRVREVRPNFRLTTANGPTVAAICRRLDALPLALELAAPWMKVLTSADLLRRLEHDVLLSPVGPRDLPERQQTMNATVAWSYQLLDPDEQRAFRRFGVLPGLFRIDAAAAVLAGRNGPLSGSDDALNATARLIDRSLLLRAETSPGATPVYQMLETVRAYAALELAAADERDDAMEGLVRYCTAEASLAVEALVGPEQAEWMDRVQKDSANYRGALAWLIDRGRADEASDIAFALMFFWLIRGRSAEGLRWYEGLLNLPYLPPAAESRALVGAALMWFMQGNLDRARAALADAHALAVDAGDMDMIVRADHLSARVEHALGNLAAARERFAAAIAGFKALSMPWGVGNAQVGMAAVAAAAGDVDGAERLLDEATSSLQHAGGWFLSRATFVRALLALHRGNCNEAIAFLRETLTRIREVRDQFALVHTLVPLASAAAIKGDAAWTARILGAQAAVAERSGVTIVVKFLHDLREEAEREARARLGPEEWERAYAAGRHSSIDGWLKDIDHALGRS